MAYIVFEELQLANFGNRIPQIEVDFEPAQETVGAALAKLAARAGVTALDCASIDLALPGYVVRRAASARSAMEELMTGFSLVGVGSPGGITIKPRGIASTGGMDFDQSAPARTGRPKASATPSPALRRQRWRPRSPHLRGPGTRLSGEHRPGFAPGWQRRGFGIL
ncbi:hypothetical protein ACFQU2_35295 [Siccirubricoccus deserti]